MALACSSAIPATTSAAPAPDNGQQDQAAQSQQEQNKPEQDQPSGGAQTGTTTAQSSDLVSRGKYLVTAGDCVGCHSRAGKPAFSGGDYMDTPFGGLAPPNITADKQYGIGAWSDDDFYRALHNGIRKDGAYIYPAMPYPWYTRVTRDDVMAIKAYLFSLPPANIPDRANRLIFPFNVRAGLAGWDALYFKPGTFKPDNSKSPEWNRGAYLVEGLAHCSDCHTPKNPAMAPIESERYAGNEITQWYAPNITSDPKQGIGKWSQSDLVSYFKKGYAPEKGVTIGPMKEVHVSLSKLTDSDLNDIAIYVKSIPPKTSYTNPTKLSQIAYNSGADIYESNCSSCHQPDGKGLAGAVPPLAGNGAVTAKGAENIIRAVLGGLPAQDTFAAMPGFAARLSSQQIADVANYVRESWGNGAPASATPELVDQLRPKTDSMMAATHWCGKPGDTPLGQFVSDQNGSVQTALAQINDVNELPTIDKVLGDVRHRVPQAKGAEIVNQLTAAYCPVVFKNGSLPKEEKAAKLDQFAALVYTQLHVSH
jgi:mono/diheme cytochrome c family protein